MTGEMTCWAGVGVRVFLTAPEPAPYREKLRVEDLDVETEAEAIHEVKQLLKRTPHAEVGHYTITDRATGQTRAGLVTL